MPTYDEYVAAAKNADAVGDAASAKHLLEQARQVQQGVSSEQIPQRGQMEDIAKGGGLGVVEGIEGLAGLPGTVQGLGTMGGKWLAEKLGMSPESIANAVEAQPKLPTPEDISNVRKQYIGDIAPPETRAGEVAQTVGRYAPNALFPTRGVAQRALNVLGPAAGEETGAQIARSVAPEWENAGRLGGSIIGAGAVTSPTKTKFIRPEVREKQVNAAYDALRKSGVEANPRGASKISTALVSAARRADVDPRLDAHKNMIQRVQSALTQLRDDQGMLKPLDFKTLQAARMKISEGYDINNKSNNRILRIMKDAFDESVDNLTPRDFSGPNGPVTKGDFAKWREARKLNTQFKKAEEMQHVHDNAMNAVGANYTNARYNTSVKQQLRGLAKNDFKKAKYFSKEEKNMILRVIRGTKEGADVEETKTLENFLRDFGKKYGGDDKMALTRNAAIGGPAYIGSLLSGGDQVTAGMIGVGAGVGTNMIGNKAATIAEEIGLHKFNNLRNVVAGGKPKRYGPRKTLKTAAKVIPYTYPRDEER